MDKATFYAIASLAGLALIFGVFEGSASGSLLSLAMLLVALAARDHSQGGEG